MHKKPAAKRNEARGKLEKPPKRREDKATETIAIINQKGGVAKTTTAHILGTGLAAIGKKVLFLDLDQGSNLSYVLGVLELGRITGKDASQLFTDTQPDSLIINGQGWDAIPASVSLASLELEDEDSRKEYHIKDALETVAAAYDYCIIDTPPGLGIITVNALTAADKIIIPARAAIFSLQGVGQLSQTLEAIRAKSNPSLSVTGILLTEYKERSMLSREITEMMEQTAQLLHTKVFTTRMRAYQAHAEAQAEQVSIYEYAPKSNAAADSVAFVKEFLKS